MLGYLFAWAIARGVVGALEDIEYNQRKQMQIQLREQRARAKERESIYVQQNITNNVQVNVLQNAHAKPDYMGMSKKEFEKEMKAFEDFICAPRNGKSSKN